MEFGLYSLLFGCSVSNMSRLHSRVQNTACCQYCFRHTASLTYPSVAVYWLPVHFHINYKIATLTYKVLTCKYLSHLLTPYTPACTLRSEGKHLLAVPATGRRGFSYASPAIWNKIPVETRNSSVLGFF